MSLHPEKELVLVLGGARSGKSSWALRHVEDHYRSYLFLATARVGDEEMAERVRLHKASRGPRWRLLEEPLDIAGALKTKCGHVEAVLVDCLTLWMSNLLLEKGEGEVPRYLDDLLKALAARDRAVVIVSNEVGMGIVPESALGRRFRDLAGLFNQRVAGIADRVVFLAAGLPMFLKGGAVDRGTS
jgi:adenosylcobinamide kinase/adenosylcobinamide-phosphate guanylyltransferase